MEIKFTQKEAEVNLLEPFRNPILELMSLSCPDYYKSEVKFFGHYEIPVVTKDGSVLSHNEDVLAAMANGQETMQVMEVEGLEKDMIPRFISKTMFFKNLDMHNRKRLIDYYEDYLRNNVKGQEWADELSKNGDNDINAKLATIFNCSKELMKHVKRETKNKPVKDEPTFDINDFEIKFSEGTPVVNYQGKAISLKNGISLKQKDGKLIIQINIKSVTSNYGKGETV